MVEDHKEDFEKRLAEKRIRRSARVDELVSIRSPKEIMKEVVTTGEPLDAFVVLADFCLPYLCCDTDCSDIELAPSTTVVAPLPGRVAGTVFARRMRSGELTRPNALREAEMVVTNLEDDSRVEVTIDRETGEFAFSARPGTYRVVTRGRGGLADHTRVIAVGENSRITENIVLTPRDR